MYVMSPQGTGVTHVHVVMPDATVPHDTSSPHRSLRRPGDRPRENAGVKESWGRA